MWHVRLVRLHEVDAHEEWLVGFAYLVKIVRGGLFDVPIEEWDSDDALFRRVNILSVDLEFLMRLLACIAGHGPLRDLGEHRPQILAHVGKPRWVCIGVSI